MYVVRPKREGSCDTGKWEVVAFIEKTLWISQEVFDTKAEAFAFVHYLNGGDLFK